MTITPTYKRARGYELQPVSQFHHVAEGIHPKFPSAYVATYLPVQIEDKKHDQWFVIQAGQIVARDVAARGGHLVLANGGTGNTLTYTANDVDYTVDIDGGGTLYDTTATHVAAAGTSSATIAANTPVGWCWYHYYSGAIRLNEAGNYDLQKDVTTMNQGTIEFPITRTAQASLDEGTLLKPESGTGWAVYFDPSSDSVDQIVGRVLWRDNITSYQGADDLSKVRTAAGTTLAGSATSGAPQWLYSKTHQTAGTATEYVRVNVTLL